MNQTQTSIKGRDADSVRRHYDIERELAARLRNSSRTERQRLYSEVYDELFRRVPDHPQHVARESVTQRALHASSRMAMLSAFLRPDATYLEVGPGDCALAFAVAPQVARVVAVDVSDEITRTSSRPDNFELALSDGVSIPVPERSVDVAMSDQLMEHLHPDDAVDQLSNIFRALAPGGVYVCATPSAVVGPHDVSRGFDEVATGFHLKEYSVGELAALFRAAGFGRMRVLFGGKGRFIPAPIWLARAAEIVIGLLPRGWRQHWDTSRLLGQFAEIRLVAWRDRS